jgi:cell wall assembly regulator SMI1
MDAMERMSTALRRFEEALQAAGHPLRGLLRPGLSADTIEELVAPTGLQLPDEAAVLWSWRDGIDSTTNTWPAGPAWGERLPGGARLLPLAEALRVWEENRDNMDWPARTDLSPHWLPLATFGSPGLLWLDCTAAPGEASPVRYVDLWENAPLQR